MWRIDYEPSVGRLRIRLTELVSYEQMRELAEQHARALEATGGQPFKVFIDLRGVFPMEPETVALMHAVKKVAASMDGCQGFAVLADSPTVVMQQQRTRIGSGKELITLNEVEAERFLSRS